MIYDGAFSKQTSKSKTFELKKQFAFKFVLKSVQVSGNISVAVQIEGVNEVKVIYLTTFRNSSLGVKKANQLVDILNSKACDAPIRKFINSYFSNTEQSKTFYRLLLEVIFNYLPEDIVSFLVNPQSNSDLGSTEISNLEKIGSTISNELNLEVDLAASPVVIDGVKSGIVTSKIFLKDECFYYQDFKSKNSVKLTESLLANIIAIQDYKNNKTKKNILELKFFPEKKASGLSYIGFIEELEDNKTQTSLISNKGSEFKTMDGDSNIATPFYLNGESYFEIFGIEKDATVYILDKNLELKLQVPSYQIYKFNESKVANEFYIIEVDSKEYLVINSDKPKTGFFNLVDLEGQVIEYKGCKFNKVIDIGETSFLSYLNIEENKEYLTDIKGNSFGNMMDGFTRVLGVLELDSKNAVIVEELDSATMKIKFSVLDDSGFEIIDKSEIIPEILNFQKHKYIKWQNKDGLFFLSDELGNPYIFEYGIQKIEGTKSINNKEFIVYRDEFDQILYIDAQNQTFGQEFDTSSAKVKKIGANKVIVDKNGTIFEPSKNGIDSLLNVLTTATGDWVVFEKKKKTYIVNKDGETYQTLQGGVNKVAKDTLAVKKEVSNTEGTYTTEPWLGFSLTENGVEKDYLINLYTGALMFQKGKGVETIYGLETIGNSKENRADWIHYKNNNKENLINAKGAIFTKLFPDGADYLKIFQLEGDTHPDLVIFCDNDKMFLVDELGRPLWGDKFKDGVDHIYDPVAIYLDIDQDAKTPNGELKYIIIFEKDKKYYLCDSKGAIPSIFEDGVDFIFTKPIWDEESKSYYIKYKESETDSQMSYIEIKSNKQKKTSWLGSLVKQKQKEFEAGLAVGHQFSSEEWRIQNPSDHSEESLERLEMSQFTKKIESLQMDRALRGENPGIIDKSIDISELKPDPEIPSELDFTLDL